MFIALGAIRSIVRGVSARTRKPSTSRTMYLPSGTLAPARRPFQRSVRKRRRCGSAIQPTGFPAVVASWTPTRSGAGSSACTLSRFSSGENSRGTAVRSAARATRRQSEREQQRTISTRRRIGRE